MATAKTRLKILKTFLGLLSENSYEEVGMPLLAKAADVKLSTLRECFTSKRALVQAFAESVDVAVLDDRDEDMADQPARDRLFDILMTRIDHLAPHRDALRALHKAARKDPGLAMEFNSIAVRSQRWMLIAAGIELSGFKGRFAAQGLAVAFARVIETWLDEDDEGMPRTMAKLDRELDQGEVWMGRFDRAARFARPLRAAGKFGRMRRRRREQTDDGVSETDAGAGFEASDA